MIEQDRERFAEALIGVGEVYDKEITEAKARIYFLALVDFDIEIVVRAMFQACKTYRFFPKPVELIEIINGGTLADRAKIEATKVLDVVRRDGRLDDLDDPVSRAVVAIGFRGLGPIGNVRDDDTQWFERRFAGLYEAYSRRGVANLGREALAAEATPIALEIERNAHAPHPLKEAVGAES